MKTRILNYKFKPITTYQLIHPTKWLLRGHHRTCWSKSRSWVVGARVWGTDTRTCFWTHCKAKSWSTVNNISLCISTKRDDERLQRPIFKAPFSFISCPAKKPGTRMRFSFEGHGMSQCLPKIPRRYCISTTTISNWPFFNNCHPLKSCMEPSAYLVDGHRSVIR